MNGEPTNELAARMLALNEQLLHAYLAELKSPSPKARRKAARGLAGLGTVGVRAIPALREALADTDKRVREAAASALDRLGGSE